ncbi:MAG: HDIG domain-containing protein, partial [Candidatus Eisenbacteria bacterium]|nr:HDIG domain-containing protein [Candidatus Eisenbacteria bacterium]
TRRRLESLFDRHPLAYRLGLAGLLLVCGLTLFPREGGYRPATYRLGTIQPRTVIASFDFPINKDPEVLAREQDEAESRVSPVLVRSDSAAAEVRQAFQEFAGLISDLRRGRFHEDRGRTDGAIAGRLPQRVVLSLLGSASGPALLQEARGRLERYLTEGIIDSVTEAYIQRYDRVSLRGSNGEWVGPPQRFYGPSRIRRDIRTAETLVSGIDRQVLTELLAAYARPNVMLDAEATQARRSLARESVPTSIGMVLKGEKIIGAHERITAEHLRKLESYEYWKQQRLGHPVFGERLRSWFGRLLLLVLILGGLGMYLAVYQPVLFYNRRETTVVAVIFGFFLVLSGILVNWLGWPALLCPLGAAAVLYALIFEPRLGLSVTAFLVGAVGLVADLGLAYLVVAGAGVAGAVLSVRSMRERKEFYRFVLFVSAAHLLALLAINFAQAAPWEGLIQEGLWAVVNPFASVALALLAIPLAEGISGRCTDMTLLELQDLNRPLMKRLMLEAPGTYHHSLMVGALAEAAVHAIGANPLLARVVAYYHDIGKLSKPDYFIENLSAGQKNPHDRLAPTMSRLILETHVREGVQLARAEKLPAIVRRGIREHHGTTLMQFFYHKARQRDPGVPREDYRYPGPRPSFPESAVILLADQVDAASRSLEDPTPSRIRNLAQSIINERAQEGELDESRLSLYDLSKIRDSFVPILAALFHGRIAYPGLAPVRSPKEGGSEREGGAAAGTAGPAPVPKEDAGEG